MSTPDQDINHLVSPSMFNRWFRPVFALLVMAWFVAPLTAQEQEMAPLTDVVQIERSAAFHTCALTISGGVKCWGDNRFGQLGDGSYTNSPLPMDVAGISDAVAITAGDYYTCALTTSGGVTCWGYNFYGQLGDDSTVNSPLPVDVKQLGNVTAISAGDRHVCALTMSGGVKCWGHNQFGQLGDGSTENSSLPVDVVDISSVTAISAGDSHTCALTSGGSVKCWGWNSSGQIGDGSHTNSSLPKDVANISSVATISAGDYHTCALIMDDGVKCWGNNGYGQLGDGSNSNSPLPVDVTELVDVMAISAGWGHTCALTTGGGVSCWGANLEGQIGDGGSTYSSSVPVSVSGLSTGAAAISARGNSTCALTEDGQVNCWGNNSYGQLGDGSLSYVRESEDVAGLSSGVAAIRTGRHHSCALTSAGEVKCWGNNSRGQLGDGTWVSRTEPINSVSFIDTSLAYLSSITGNHACALSSHLLGVYCWGSNDAGQLGIGNTQDQPNPVGVQGLEVSSTAIATGLHTTCVITGSGGARCWGNLGYGLTEDVPGLASNVTAISVGDTHICALQSGGVKCWGNNSYGQLGDGNTSLISTTPMEVLGLTSGVTAISVGVYHTCALTENNSVKCWGNNSYGQLGDGSNSNRALPVDVAELDSVTAISAGYGHTCARTVGGGAKCWGDNAYGQLGNGSIVQQLTPVDVAGLENSVATISAGWHHTCAMTTTGGAKCWGDNQSGQLGSGGRNYGLPGDVLVRVLSDDTSIDRIELHCFFLNSDCAGSTVRFLYPDPEDSSIHIGTVPAGSNEFATFRIFPSDPETVIALDGYDATFDAGIGAWVSELIQMQDGENVFHFTVTAQNGNQSAYTAIIIRPRGNDASLSHLDPGVGALLPAFDPDINAYSLSVPNATDTLPLIVNTTSPDATVTANGETVVNSATQLPLEIGSNVFDMLVTAPDGETTRTYTLTVLRQADLGIGYNGWERVGTQEGTILRISNSSAVSSTNTVRLVVQGGVVARLATLTLTSCSVNSSGSLSSVNCPNIPTGVHCNPAAGACTFANGIDAGHGYDVIVVPADPAAILRAIVEEGGLEAAATCLRATAGVACSTGDAP